MAVVVGVIDGAVLRELVPFIGVVGRMVLNGIDVEADDAVCSRVWVVCIAGVRVTGEVERIESGVDKEV